MIHYCFVSMTQVFDEAALSMTVSEEMEKCFPEARFAHLKSGGNFPFLSRAAEVNVLIRVNSLLSDMLPCPLL